MRSFPCFPSVPITVAVQVTVASPLPAVAVTPVGAPGGADGVNPNGLIRDSAENLYGTTYYGGTSGAGVVFKLDTTGKETVLYSFTGGADGGNPYAGVIRAESMT